ncbi:hypothetical protein ACLB2K_002662 [Fragaria x ananassa]
MADQKKTSEDDRRKRSRSCADEDDQAIRNDDRWLIPERKVVMEIIRVYCDLNSMCMRSRSLSTNNKSKPPSSSELLDKLQEEQRDIADNKLWLVVQSTEFDRKAQCITLKKPLKLYKPRHQTKIAYSCVTDTVTDLIKRNKSRTLRGVFYLFKGIFKSQSRSNAAIKHLCSKLGANRESMNLRPDDVSLVIGPLKYTL